MKKFSPFRYSLIVQATSKLWLSALGFALLFRFAQPLNVVAVFAGYITMIITQWWLARKIATLAAAEPN